jgi:predicted metal-dependent phosphoesterase TrpH
LAVDLHTHSDASDGTDPPATLVSLAAAAGLRAIALTDHDTLEGVEEAATEAARLGVELVPGTELSLNWPAGAMHLVVLFLAPGPGPLQDRLAGLQAGRTERNRAMIELLNRSGLEITYDDVLAEAGRGSVGRPHMAAVLVRRGLAADINDAFDRWLAHGRPGYLDRHRLDPEEAIALARQSGAVPVLAHPHTLGLDAAAEYAATLRRLADAGLVGMECHYSLYSPSERAEWVSLARRFSLLPSGGSDYHGRYKPEISVGRGRGDLLVGDEVLEELRPT